MMGLVGTYDQGLHYIWDQNRQQISRQKQQKQYLSAAAAAAPAGPEEDSDEDCAVVSGPDSPVSEPADSALVQADSPLGQVLFRGRSIGASSIDSRDSSGHSTDIAVDIAASLSAAEEGIMHGAACNGDDREDDRLAEVWHRPKVIMWLGSSIGNCNREQAVSFLQQVKEKAMSKGRWHKSAYLLCLCCSLACMVRGCITAWTAAVISSVLLSRFGASPCHVCQTLPLQIGSMGMQHQQAAAAAAAHCDTLPFYICFR